VRVLRLQHRLVDITPDPVFVGFKGLDEGMFRGVKMLCGVLIGRIVTASDVTADQANAQMDPGTAYFQAIFTTLGAWCDVVNLVQMGTIF